MLETAIERSVMVVGSNRIGATEGPAERGIRSQAPPLLPRTLHRDSLRRAAIGGLSGPGVLREGRFETLCSASSFVICCRM